MRRAARVDGNQTDIVAALRRIGVSVEVLGKPLDLMICHRGETSLMECKDPRPSSEGGAHGLTKDQIEFIARWPGKIHIVHSVDEAMLSVLGEEAMR